MMVTFPQEFDIGGSGCSLPNDMSCSLSGSSMRLDYNGTISTPLAFTINSVLTPTFTPSSIIYLQTYSTNGYRMDSNL